MKTLNESVLVSQKEVMCDGPPNDVALGHPRIYLHMQSDDRVECPYCGKVFIYDQHQN